MMTSTQALETFGNVTTNSRSQDHTHPDDHTLPTDKPNLFELYLETIWKIGFWTGLVEIQDGG